MEITWQKNQLLKLYLILEADMYLREGWNMVFV